MPEKLKKVKDIKDLSLEELQGYFDQAVKVIRILKFNFDMVCLSFLVAGAAFMIFLNFGMPYKIALVLPIIFSLFSYQFVLPKLKKELMEISWIIMELHNELQKRESEDERK